MKRLSAKQLREAWISFFERNGHLYVECKSLIPVNDPSLLWINSGVATLKKYFSGIENPPANRLVNLQKAVRTNDIENVGKTARHHTFFEMMGNFSIGDYFKKEAIKFAYDFLINDLEIEKEKLYITVYEDDDVAYARWKELGISEDHLLKENRDRNFWDVGNGPCGPCTEIYFDRGSKYDPKNIGLDLLKNDEENDRYVEIWNIVFSEFNNDGSNHYEELKRKNIDTGAGYERFLSVLQDVPTNYDTDLFLPIIETIEKNSNKKYITNAFFSNDLNQIEINRYFKVIADHIKSAVFMVADGALPSNKDRGYILRRLIRRAIAFGEKLDLQNNWLEQTINEIINVMKDFYPYLVQNQRKIQNVILNEQKQFSQTLKEGLKHFNKALEENNISAKTVFDLVQTYGFPKVLVDEMCNDNQVTYSQQEYEELFKQHQIISKANNTANIKALVKQNKNLLDLKIDSSFDYEKDIIHNAKIVALFDDEFNVIETLNGSGWVVLDKTCMYATGGGQTHDDGWINEFVVDNVIKGPNLQHLHHVNEAYFELNQTVTVKHDVLVRSLLRANHSAVHMIQALLKRNINPIIKQAGAFKSKDKWSFDFNYDQKISSAEIQKIEDDANEVIKAQLPIHVLSATLEEAQKRHAVMEFTETYLKQKHLRLIEIGNLSLELCGGTHAKNTAELEILKITSFASLGSGTWRIEGYTKYLNYQKHLQEQLLNIVDKNNENLHVNAFKENDHFISEKIITDIDRYFEQQQIQKNKLKEQQELDFIKNKVNQAILNDEYLVTFNAQNPKNIAKVIKELSNNLTQVLVVVNELKQGFGYFIVTSKNYLDTKQLDLNKHIKELETHLTNAKSGGNKNYFQGGCEQAFDKNLFLVFLKQVNN